MAFESTIYSGRFITNLDRRTVGMQITNQNYSVVGARTVQVWAADDLSAPDKNADNSVNIQNPSGAATPMALDQEKDLSVLVPSVDEFQSSVNMQTKFRERQVQASEESIDDFVLAKHPDATTTLSTTATTASGFDSVIRDAKVALSDLNVPRSMRWMVLSPTYADLAAEAAGDRMRINTEIETEGYVGRYQGFDIFESTGVADDGTKQQNMFGHTAAITLAKQIEDFFLIPSSQNSSHHGDLLKGLLVYGAQTFLPDALGVIDADLPA